MSITLEKQKEILREGKKTIEDFNTGYLKAEMGYKFRTKAMLDVIFLYINGVDVRNPDLLGKTNKNTFVHEAQAEIRKIKEQTRLDLKDINFLISGASPLARFIVKGANRKMLKDNQFADDLDDVADDAVDFGSGFLEAWEVDGKMKLKHRDPYHMIFNQYNFKDGMKIRRLRKTVKQILENEKYDADVRVQLSNKYSKEEQSKELIIFQGVKDFKDGSQEISVFDIDNELVYFNQKTDERIISYYKFDYEKRKGFIDALGKGCNEMIFNKLVQSKVNRERLDAVMEIASKLPFQKEIDNERDAYVGKEVTKIKTGAIIGHRGNEIKPMDTGGIKQANVINQQLGSIIQTIGPDLNVSEALQGNTLPSGTSGALGNLLTENSSSVLKEVKKKYAQFISVLYEDRLIEYLLRVFDKSENLKKYLDPNDIKTVETNVIGYLVSLKQVDSAINNVPFDVVIATEEVKQEIKGKPLVSGNLLDTLRSEVKGIETFISGEKTSKAQTVAFLREMRNTYAKNPELFKQPFFVETLKKEAEFEAGISGVEIDNLLKELE